MCFKKADLKNEIRIQVAHVTSYEYTPGDFSRAPAPSELPRLHRRRRTQPGESACNRKGYQRHVLPGPRHYVGTISFSENAHPAQIISIL